MNISLDVLCTSGIYLFLSQWLIYWEIFLDTVCSSRSDSWVICCFFCLSSYMTSDYWTFSWASRVIMVLVKYVSFIPSTEVARPPWKLVRSVVISSSDTVMRSPMIWFGSSPELSVFRSQDFISFCMSYVVVNVFVFRSSLWFE
jgi:hypothetical protein